MNANLFWDANIKCEFCEATFNSQDSLKQHLRLHSRRKPYKCDECGARFSYNSTLDWHRKSHSGEMPFKCDECNAQFTQNSMLIWHKRKHRMIETSQNPGVVVNMANLYHQQNLQNFSNMFSVSSVMTASATPVANITLPVCMSEPVSDVGQMDVQMNISCTSEPLHSDLAVSSSSLGILADVHEKRKVSKEEGVFRCDICCTTFAYSTDLKGHVETKHNMGENNPYHILARQQQASGFISNKRKIIQEKLFKCDLCYAGFNTEGHLKSHRQKHVVGRPYKCSKCGLTFSDKSILESHERRHQAERPFKCDRCGAAFFRQSHLQKHIKRHTGDFV
ncbi:zinc finger protein 676-like [Palaemon carinicauda]|uniref:zinc finger protein 676-like n=1 Tax=Palaemon carinicauda TaxID=392227 RepID=UPI0035B64CFB